MLNLIRVEGGEEGGGRGEGREEEGKYPERRAGEKRAIEMMVRGWGVEAAKEGRKG
jgi:hypothetical protein